MSPTFPAPRSKTVSIVVRFVLAALMATTIRVWRADPAAAQLWEGNTGLKAYAIVVDGHRVGDVVVVGADREHPPPGYAAGWEYWAWSTAPWPTAFTLIPTSTVPDHGAHRWETFPHEHFDLSTTVPMPAIFLTDEDDCSYRVRVATPSGWVVQGLMVLDTNPLGGPSVQDWFGVGLTSDLVGRGGPIHFQAARSPAAGSIEVFQLRRDNAGRAVQLG